MSALLDLSYGLEISREEVSKAARATLPISTGFDVAEGNDPQWVVTCLETGKRWAAFPTEGNTVGFFEL